MVSGLYASGFVMLQRDSVILPWKRHPSSRRGNAPNRTTFIMWNIIIGAAFIIGGISGKMVLRGTDSTMGIAVVGVVLVVWGFFQVSSGKSRTAARSTKRHTTRRQTPNKRQRVH